MKETILDNYKERLTVEQLRSLLLHCPRDYAIAIGDEETSVRYIVVQHESKIVEIF